MTDNPIGSMPGISVGDGPDPKRWSILLVVVIAQLMVVLDASIVTIALPSAQRSLHFSVANRRLDQIQNRRDHVDVLDQIRHAPSRCHIAFLFDDEWDV